MSWARSSRFVLASVALHVLGGAAILAVRRPPARNVPRTIQVEVRRPARPEATAATPEPVRAKPQPAPAPVAPPPSAPLRETTKRAPLPPTLPSTPPPANPPPSSPPSTPPTQAERQPPPSAPSKRIDLFNSRALEVAVGSSPDAVVVPQDGWGGRTLSAAAGQRDPNLRDASLDREEAAGRIGRFLGEAASAERLKGGNVAPRWRNAERVAQQSFHPAMSLVSDDNAVGGFIKNWMNSRVEANATPRGVDDSRSSFNGLGGAGAGARMQRGEGGRTRTEVEVVVAADGTIVSAKVVSRSGRRKFDEEAVALVKKACSKGGPLDEKTAVVTRWAVEAWMDVTPPAPVAGLSFDESTGKVGLDHPLRKSVKTSVRLISLVAQR